MSPQTPAVPCGTEELRILRPEQPFIGLISCPKDEVEEDEEEEEEEDNNEVSSNLISFRLQCLRMCTVYRIHK
jgi:hypothetical protein